MKTKTRVCPTVGCPELVGSDGTCARGHGRPRNAPWSRNRDRQAQATFRQAVLRRDGYRCVRDGHTDPTGQTLVAHHVRPGYDPSAGITLCKACHKEIDRHAR